jgi:hypothetical protein
MILQLNPPLPLNTPKGEGLAHFLIDDGIEHDDYWKVCITATGEWWTFNNRFVRGTKNITMGRTNPTPIIPPPGEPIPVDPTSIIKPQDKPILVD